MVLLLVELQALAFFARVLRASVEPETVAVSVARLHVQHLLLQHAGSHLVFLLVGDRCSAVDSKPETGLFEQGQGVVLDDAEGRRHQTFVQEELLEAAEPCLKGRKDLLAADFYFLAQRPLLAKAELCPAVPEIHLGKMLLCLVVGEDRLAKVELCVAVQVGHHGVGLPEKELLVKLGIYQVVEEEDLYANAVEQNKKVVAAGPTEVLLAVATHEEAAGEVLEEAGHAQAVEAKADHFAKGDLAPRTALLGCPWFSLSQAACLQPVPQFFDRPPLSALGRHGC